MARRVLMEEDNREPEAKDSKAERFKVPPPTTMAPRPPQPSAQDLQLESNYVSLADTGISSFRSRGGSVDVSDVTDGTRRAQGVSGEVLPEDHAEDDYEDTSSEEGVVAEGGVEGDVIGEGMGDRHHPGTLGSSGAIGLVDLGLAGLRLGAGEIGIGGTEIGRQEIAGIAKLEKLEIPLPPEGPNGSGQHGGVALVSPVSVPGVSGDDIQPALPSPHYEPISNDLASVRRRSISPRSAMFSEAGVVREEGRRGLRRKLRRGTRHAGVDGDAGGGVVGAGGDAKGAGVRGRDAEGIDEAAARDNGDGRTPGRERSTTGVSSSSDESLGGDARLSGPAMKQQWEEAMSVMPTSETPLRSRRTSMSVDGVSSRGSGFLSPGRRALMASAPSEGVSTRLGQSASLGVGRGATAAAASVLGTHLRTYGWVADEDVTECMNACGKDFTTWERRHHCRSCGGIYCHDCSRHRCLIPDPVAPPSKACLDPTKPHRVCKNCCAELQPQQDDLLAAVSKARRHNTFRTDSPARHCNPPFGRDLAHEVRKAANTLNNALCEREGCDGLGANLMGDTEQKISNSLLRSARGLVFVTVGKAGFVYAAEAGMGLCVARLANGEWSAPAAVGTFGVSWGFQAGCEVVDVVMPLRSDAAVEMLKCGGQVYLEVDLALAVGHLGRSLGTGLGGRVWPGEDSAVNMGAHYSLCKGLFAGIGIGAGFVRVMDGRNEQFYGVQVTPRSLLAGVMPRPMAAAPLYRSLERLDRSLAIVRSKN